MSSPISELLKRPDELFVVEHAHLRPRFVEDSVRVALAATLDAYPELADGDFLLSRQVNLETIHDHDVIAERHGTVGELRGELDDGRAGRRPHRPRRLARGVASARYGVRSRQEAAREPGFSPIAGQRESAYGTRPC